MPYFAYLVIFVLIVLAKRVSSGALGYRNVLLRTGTPARGLVLRASSVSTETSYEGQRFELRTLLLDVEVPGAPPYEVSVTPMIPRICEALPGASLDLRVDRSNRQRVAIVGPAGSSGWLDVAAAVPGQTWGPSTLMLGAGSGTLLAGLVIFVLAVASIYSFLGLGQH
jgi:hypothetical protein